MLWGLGDTRLRYEGMLRWKLFGQKLKYLAWFEMEQIRAKFNGKLRGETGNDKNFMTNKP
jgi:hypothetical protein